MGSARLLTSLIAYLSASPKADLGLSESHFITCGCRGRECQRSQGRFLRGATSGGDLKEYNLTGDWRGNRLGLYIQYNGEPLFQGLGEHDKICFGERSLEFVKVNQLGKYCSGVVQVGGAGRLD